MIESPGLPLTLLAFLLVIGPLVFIHELGHYLAGRWCGIKADVFSIGFGREVIGWSDQRGTRWKVGWLPLGGYVKFAGDMNPAGQPSADWLSLPAEDRNRTFQAKPLWQRAIVVAAGPFVNFVAAILILMGFALAYGESRTPTVVAGTVAGSAAAKAGLRQGDVVTAIGGREMASFEDMLRYVKIRPGETVAVDFTRNGRPQRVSATIGTATEQDRFGKRYKSGLLGVKRGEQVVLPVRLIDAPGIAVRQTVDLLGFMTDTIGQIISGRRSVKDLSGPVGMAQAAGQQFVLGWSTFVFLIALVSINLGFINLLPVPMLDGGHLMFYAIEAVRRKPVGPEVQEWAYRGGLAALLALMLFVTFNDLGTVGLWKNLAGLIG